MEIKDTLEGTALTVEVSGSVNTQTAPELEKDIEKHADGVTAIIIDLAKVEYISSSGLRVLLSTQKRMDAVGGKLTVRGATPEIREIFDMTGFTSILNLE